MHKSTREQIVNACIELMAREDRAAVVREQLQRAYGISQRSAERRYAEAKARLLEAAQAKREDVLADALAQYRAVIRDAWRAKPVDRSAVLRAQERLDKVLGLEAAQKIEHSGTLRTEAADSFLAELPDDLRTSVLAALPEE